MNIASFLAHAAAAFPHAPAVSLGTSLLHDYAGLQARVASLAAGLRAMPGMQPGDRVAVVMKNSPRYIEIVWAAWHAGLCVVPINARLHAREVGFILRHCSVRCVFASDDVVHAIAQELQGEPIRVVAADAPAYAQLAAHAPMGMQSVDAAQPAWLFYTSGTTGRPKGATLTHHSLLAMTLRYYADVDHLTHDDSIVHAAPLSHASGLYAIAHVAKASHQIIPESGSFDTDEMFDLVNAGRQVTFFTAPTMMRRMVEQAASRTLRLDRLRTIFYGGAPMYLSDLQRALDCFGPRLWQGYGQGESPNTITSLSKRMHVDDGNADHLARLASVGVARTGVEVRVVADDGRSCAHGEVGEVICRSDVTMAGYWNDAAATARALRGGWLYTGDLGCFDAAGFLTLKDRSKDVIISGGSNIYPREVEEALLTHADVLETSVVGMPDAEWGEQVVAFVVLRNARTGCEAELDQACLAQIARFKRPKRYVFVQQLPKSDYGKVLKTSLRQMLAQESATQ